MSRKSPKTILPLDKDTSDWLYEVAFEAGTDPATIAASILRDVCRDDRREHGRHLNTTLH